MTSGPRSAWAARAAKNVGLRGRVVAQRDRLLALVDHQDRHRTRRRQRGERVHRTGTRGDHHDTTAVALQRGSHPGSHQRRLAAARGSDHREHADRRQPAETRLDLAVAPEEAVGVVDVVGHQAQVGAGRARLRQRRRGDQRRVLAQDRLFQARPGPGPDRGRARRRAPGGPGAGSATRHPAARPGTGPWPAAPTGAPAAAPPPPVSAARPAPRRGFPARSAASSRTSSASNRSSSRRPASTRPSSQSSRSRSARPRHNAAPRRWCRRPVRAHRA